MTLMQQLQQAGIPVDGYYSDLHFPATEESLRILKQYPHALATAKAFQNKENGELWMDVPFLFDPFWDRLVSHE